MYIILLIIHFLITTTIFGLKPIVSLYANSQGASALIIGMLVSIYAVTPMLTALYVGKWLDRFGAKRMLLVGSSLMVFAVSIPVLHVGLSSLFVAQMFLGFSQIFIVVSIQKTVGNLAGSRDKLIATLSFVGSAGGLTGPLLTGFSYDILGVEAAFMVVIGLVSVAWFLIILLRKNCCPITGLSETPKKESSWCLFKNKNLRNALLISGMVLYSKELFSAYFPIFASEQGISPSMIGLILSFAQHGRTLTGESPEYDLVAVST